MNINELFENIEEINRLQENININRFVAIKYMDNIDTIFSAKDIYEFEEQIQDIFEPKYAEIILNHLEQKDVKIQDDLKSTYSLNNIIDEMKENNEEYKFGLIYMN